MFALIVTHVLLLKMYNIVEYVSADGVSPFSEWFQKLDTKAALKVRTAIARMEVGNLGDSKSVGQGVLERRLTFGPGYRIYYGRDGDKIIILLTGGTKKRQDKDIERAKTLWLDFKQRKGD